MIKNYASGWLFLLFTGLSFAGSAQNMGAVNAAINRNNQHFQHQMMHQQMLMNLRAANNSGLTNRKADYKVELTSGSTITVHSRMEFDKTGKAYLLLIDKSKKKNDSLREQKITPAMTKSINYVQLDNPDLIKGNPADSCWLFKSIAGAVNAYSFLPERYNLHVGYLKMIQKGTGNLLPLNEENLKALLADDEKALAQVSKKNYFEAIKRYNKNSSKQATAK